MLFRAQGPSEEHVVHLCVCNYAAKTPVSGGVSVEMGRVCLGASNSGDGNPEKTEYVEFSSALCFTEALSLHNSMVSVIQALKNELVMNKTKHTSW